MKELEKIEKRIIFYSDVRPKNMTAVEHRQLLDELFDQKRRLLAGEPTPKIDKAHRGLHCA